VAQKNTAMAQSQAAQKGDPRVAFFMDFAA